MAFTTLMVQPETQPVSEKQSDNNGTVAASLLSALLLGAYAAGKSKKAMRKFKRQMMWSAFKLKIKSMFSKNADVSDRTLLLILVGVLLLALLLIYWPLGLAVILLLLILYLLGVLKV